MVLLELYAPTFGDIKMPTDDYCLYHCFNYAGSNGTSTLTEDYAKRLQTRVYHNMWRWGKFDQADRLMESGSAGYPDEEDFQYFAKEVGYSFAIVQAPILEPLVYGSELGPVCLTVRRLFTADGEGHLSPHYDVVSYEAPTILTFEELGAKKLDAYKEFLLNAIRADSGIGNTELIAMLEETHGVSAKTSTMRWWRGSRNKPKHTPMADLPLHEACDAYDALFDALHQCRPL